MPGFYNLYAFNNFIGETSLPPVHGFNFDTWDEVYAYTLAKGVEALEVHNNKEASVKILAQLNAWKQQKATQTM